jgi:hypothetical protein
MDGFAEVVSDLISGTAVEKNELELAKLRALPPDKQLEVGIILHESNQQESLPPGLRQERLMRVMTIEQALVYLISSEANEYSTDYLEQGHM